MVLKLRADGAGMAIFAEKTERQYADELGVFRNAVHVRKMKVLKKLRALLEGSIEKP